MTTPITTTTTDAAAAEPTVDRRTRLPLRSAPWFALVIIFLFVVSAVFAPWITSFDPLQPDLPMRLSPPSSEHLLGTDAQGRDMLTRLLFGARSSLVVIVLALGTSAFIGMALGLLAGYLGGLVDATVSRTVEAVLAFPAIFFGLVFAVTIGAGTSTVVLAIALVLWGRFARVIRDEVRTVREREFIARARVNGCSSLRIMVVHILPNVVSSSMIIVSITMGYIISLEATLSYLGAGIPPPTPSWGGMISQGQSHLSSAWWVSVVPGVAILLTVLSFNLLGDWLRSWLDPRQRDRLGLPPTAALRTGGVDAPTASGTAR